MLARYLLYSPHQTVSQPSRRYFSPIESNTPYTVDTPPLLLSAGLTSQNTVAEGTQRLKLGACIRQSTRRNARGGQIAAAIVAFL